MTHYPPPFPGAQTRRIPVEHANGVECLNCDQVRECETPPPIVIGLAFERDCCTRPALQPVLITPCAVKVCSEIAHVVDRHIELCLA